ncbi:Retinoblastoma-like protein 2 [Halotydeus destructor]|nr:Retinoblastoma-like protein 2 [Halotydeus destructor]
MRDLCDRLNIADDDLKRKIWTCFELSLRNHTDLMKDRHLDQLLMCAIYAMCKVARHEISFQEIMKCYRLQPQSTSHIYRSVLLNNRGRRNSASSENSRNSGSASPIGSQEERERIRSSSTLPIPHPSSQPPTPTRLAGTGSQFDFGEERGDLIMFYNQVYVPEMKSYIMKFTTENSSPMLSPLPRLAQNPVSPCRRISQQHKLFISPMKAPNFPPSPKRPLSYSFLRSPAKDLNKINLMMKGLSDKKPVSKRILQDDASENENSPVKRHCSDPVLFRSKIQNIFTERQGSVASEDSSSNFVENGNDSSGGF